MAKPLDDLEDRMQELKERYIIIRSPLRFMHLTRGDDMRMNDNMI